MRLFSSEIEDVVISGRMPTPGKCQDMGVWDVFVEILISDDILLMFCVDAMSRYHLDPSISVCTIHIHTHRLKYTHIHIRFEVFECRSDGREWDLTNGLMLVLLSVAGFKYDRWSS